ncbi:MAG: replicative helicase loader/inhibitor [Alkaliphilus sp.]
MTKQEGLIILGILKTAYPRFYTNIQKNEVENAVLLWSEMLTDYSLDVIKIAIKKLIAESVYPPTIADVRKSLVSVSKGDGISVAGAWGEVHKAIRRFGSYQEEKALESLSKTTQKIVKYMGYKYLCLSENQMADRAHFIKMHSQLVEREQKDALIPNDIKLKIDELINSSERKLTLIKTIKGA